MTTGKHRIPALCGERESRLIILRLEHTGRNFTWHVWPRFSLLDFKFNFYTVKQKWSSCAADGGTGLSIAMLSECQIVEQVIVLPARNQSCPHRYCRVKLDRPLAGGSTWSPPQHSTTHLCPVPSCLLMVRWVGGFTDPHYDIPVLSIWV